MCLTRCCRRGFTVQHESLSDQKTWVPCLAPRPMTSPATPRCCIALHELELRTFTANPPTTNALRHAPRQHQHQAEEPNSKLPISQLHLPCPASSGVPSPGNLVFPSAPRVLAALGGATAPIIHHFADCLLYPIPLCIPAPSWLVGNMAGSRGLVQRLDLDAGRGTGLDPGTIRGLFRG